MERLPTPKSPDVPTINMRELIIMHVVLAIVLTIMVIIVHHVT